MPSVAIEKYSQLDSITPRILSTNWWSTKYTTGEESSHKLMKIVFFSERKQIPKIKGEGVNPHFGKYNQNTIFWK